ncbi:MAG: hypothetical protein CMK92_05895 [Pseudomonas sp.]|nr:hypothetical protein [Pseudomonas sp.]
MQSYKRVIIQTTEEHALGGEVVVRDEYVIELDPGISSLTIPTPIKPWFALHQDYIRVKLKNVRQGTPIYNEDSEQKTAQIKECDLLDESILCFGIDEPRDIAEYQLGREFLDHVIHNTKSFRGEFRGTPYEIVDYKDKPFLVIARNDAITTQSAEIRIDFRFSDGKKSCEIPDFENVLIYAYFPAEELGYGEHALTPMYDLKLLENMYNRIAPHKNLTPQIERSTDKYLINRLLERIVTLEKTKLPHPSRRTTW